VGDGVGEGVGEAVGVGLGVGVGVGVRVGVGVGDGVGEGVGVGVGVGAGATAINPDTPVIEESDESVVMTVSVPNVFNVTTKDPAPFVNVPLPGRSAAGSLLVTWTVPE
jgi:hypothetical protein